MATDVHQNRRPPWAEQNRITGEWHGKSEKEPQEVEKAGKHQTAHAFAQIVSEFDGKSTKIRQLI
jgi:hypothetical protein